MTQAHPELKSRPTRPHPLFSAFVGAALAYQAGEQLPVEIPEIPEIPESPGPATNGTHPDGVERPLTQPASRG